MISIPITSWRDMLRWREIVVKTIFISVRKKISVQMRYITCGIRVAFSHF